MRCYGRLRRSSAVEPPTPWFNQSESDIHRILRLGLEQVPHGRRGLPLSQCAAKRGPVVKPQLPLDEDSMAVTDYNSRYELTLCYIAWRSIRPNALGFLGMNNNPLN